MFCWICSQLPILFNFNSIVVSNLCMLNPDNLESDTCTLRIKVKRMRVHPRLWASHFLSALSMQCSGLLVFINQIFCLYFLLLVFFYLGYHFFDKTFQTKSVFLGVNLQISTRNAFLAQKLCYEIVGFLCSVMSCGSVSYCSQSTLIASKSSFEEKQRTSVILCLYFSYELTFK